MGFLTKNFLLRFPIFKYHEKKSFDLQKPLKPKPPNFKINRRQSLQKYQ